MRKIILLLNISLLAMAGYAQQWDTAVYSLKYNKLNKVFESGEYNKALILLKEQLNYLVSTAKEDSLFRYVPIAGRCYWKVINAEKGQAEAEKLVGRVMAVDHDTTHHLIVLSDLSWLYYETGNDAMCLKTDERYISVCRKFSKSSAMQLSTGYYNLGFDYLAAGNGKLSVDFFNLSIKPLLADSLANGTALIERYNALGSGLYRLGNYRAAKEAYGKSLFYASGSLDAYEASSSMANCYGNLSLIAQDEGNFLLSKEYLENSLEQRSIALSKAGEPHLIHQEQDNLVKGYTNLASIYLHIGEFARTEKLLLLAKEERAKLLESNDPRIYLIDESFGSYYLAIGDPARALESITKYKKACQEHYGEKSFWTGFAWNRLAQIYVQLNDDVNAIKSVTEAIRIFELIGDSQEMADCFMLKCSANSRLDKMTEAKNDFNRALVLYTASRNAYDPALAKCHLVMGENCLAHKDFANAVYHANEAMNILSVFKGRMKSSSGRLAHHTPWLPEVLVLKARIMAVSDNSISALKQSSELVSAAIKEIRFTEKALDHNSSRLQFYSSHESTFSFAQDIAFQLYEKTGDKAYLEALMTFAEENKTVMLRRQLSAFSSINFSNVPDSIIAKENEMMRLLQHQDAQKDNIVQSLENEQAFDKLLEVIEVQYPQYYNLKYNDVVSNIKQIQEELCVNGKNIIEFVVTDSTIYALVISALNFDMVSLKRAGLIELVKAFNDAVLQFQESAINKYGHELYNQLFAPLQVKLDAKELLIIPDNEIFQVNFDILQQNPGGGISGLLIQDYTISYLLSATTALQFKSINKKGGKGILALAPGFSDELKQEFARNVHGINKIDGSFLACIQQPFALKCASQLVNIFPGISFTGYEATEGNFRKHAPKYGIVHFGTHTEINNESPMLSRLILTSSGEDSIPENDGFLHAYEIYDLELKAELAVLTACQTGSGLQNNSEGVFSLAHSFTYAGCPSVVMSLWQIDEKTSSEIIALFYTNLADGLSRNEALRQAKLQFLNTHEGELLSPYYWAGMVLLGETSPLEQAHNWSFWWLILAGVIIGIVVVYRRMRKKLEV